MAVDDLREDVGHLGLRIDVVELAGLDERGDDRPVLSPAVGTREERVLAIERHHPFILPMSGRSWKSTTDGIHILAARSRFVALSSERLANFLKCKGRPASWSRWPVGCSIP